MNKHVFLKAPPGTGKTTVIGKVIGSLGPSITPGGFYTYFCPYRFGSFFSAAPEKTAKGSPRGEFLYMQQAGLETACDEAHAVARFTGGGKPEVYTERFNSFGRAFIGKILNGSDILVFDECSRLESAALEFQESVISALGGGVPIIGVYRITDKDSWTRKIAEHPKVETVELTMENRDKTARELSDYFRQVVFGHSANVRKTRL
jgi:nucleoside-triphosphatase THEP1